VLTAAGFDPNSILGRPVAMSHPVERGDVRRRSSGWPERVLSAWDRHCAFCSYDGQRGSAAVGIEAAHVRWYNIDGPDELDNGLALCALDHKLFDRGDLALTERAMRSPSRTPSPPAPAQDGGSTTSRDAKSSHGRGQAFPRPVTSTGTRPRFKSVPLAAEQWIWRHRASARACARHVCDGRQQRYQPRALDQSTHCQKRR
jgi:hypothetical protein